MDKNTIRYIKAAEMAMWILNNNPDFYDGWQELKGYSGGNNSPITAAIDSATGFDKVRMHEFIEDVADLVIDRLPPNPEAISPEAISPEPFCRGLKDRYSCPMRSPLTTVHRKICEYCQKPFSMHI